MKKLVAKAYDICWKNRHLLDNPEEWEPIFSFDRPYIHDPAYLTDLGVIEGQNTFPLPCYAPDIHKVIEHVHGTLTTLMGVYLQRVRRPQGNAVHRAQLEHLFWGLSAARVQSDTMSLVATLRIIADPVAQGGTAGDWAPRPYN